LVISTTPITRQAHENLEAVKLMKIQEKGMASLNPFTVFRTLILARRQAQ